MSCHYIAHVSRLKTPVSSLVCFECKISPLAVTFLLATTLRRPMLLCVSVPSSPFTASRQTLFDQPLRRDSSTVKLLWTCFVSSLDPLTTDPCRKTLLPCRTRLRDPSSSESHTHRVVVLLIVSNHTLVSSDPLL